MDDPAVRGAVAQLIAAVATIILLIGTAVAKRIQDGAAGGRRDRKRRKADRDADANRDKDPDDA